MEKEKIVDEIKTQKEDISKLKQQLSTINENKEWWFKRKEALKAELNALISKIKQLRPGRGPQSEELRKLKSERDKYNHKVKELISEIKKLKDERNKAFKKVDENYNPSQIKKRIDHLEMELQTEVYSFKKEKEVMENIKKLKKMYEEGSVISEMSRRIREVSEQIDVSRKVADELHNKLKEFISKNKGELSEFRKTSKEIDKIKKEQEAAFDKFITFKKEFAQANELLKEKLSKTSQLQETINRLRKEKESIERREIREEKQEKVDELLKEKVKEVEEKLKKGKKLTTQDLIAYQGRKDEE